jgi:hypothetical protein
MPDHADAIRLQLTRGPLSSKALQQRLALSQPTVSRALAALAGEVERIGAARTAIYALRDAGRGVDSLAVYRVDAQGRLAEIGRLVPVRPAGYVMHRADGVSLHSEGLPWWLADMRPQGFLGRAYAARHAATLGLPANLSEWSDAHALRALVAHGHDAVGNLLLGEAAREQFLAAPAPEPIPPAGKGARYAALAREAARGEAPGSSAGGEQPKFLACVQGSPRDGGEPRHVLVKFSVAEDSPVSGRWRDLLLAEHLALACLREAGVAASRTGIVDYGTQRFLEVERFDRVGERGRRALLSLGSLDDQFVGLRQAPWSEVAQRLAAQGHVQAEAVRGAALLYAFGTLIGNTDMHAGNLSFMTDGGRPYALAPAYDMLPMGFAPGASGALRDTLPALRLAPGVPAATWREALALAHHHLARLGAHGGFSPRFAPCLDALAARLIEATEQVHRLGD